jgi:hypothetical protein
MITASERAKTVHALDRSPTVTGYFNITKLNSDTISTHSNIFECVANSLVATKKQLSYCRLHNYGGLHFICRVYFSVYNTKFSEALIACFPLMRHGSHGKKKILLLLRVFICCGGNVFIEPLPSNQRKINTVTQTHGRDLWSTPLRWTQVPCYKYQVS